MQSGSEDRGAEAVVSAVEYLDLPAVRKERVPKGYRHPDLDRSLRAHRTKNEARLLREARSAGVRTPAVYDVDLSAGTMTMELLEGEKVRDLIDGRPERLAEVCGLIGTAVGRMHRHGICHGDLTTSNMILSPEGELCLFDFSLGSQKADLEAMGVDLHLLERGLASAHSEHPEAFGLIAEAYRREMPDADSVLDRVEVIRKRARYT